MSGNLSEWTSSFYCDYATGEGCKPLAFVTRGGAWHEKDTHYMRTTYRDWVFANHSGYNLGFRCARSIPDAPEPVCDQE